MFGVNVIIYCAADNVPVIYCGYRVYQSVIEKSEISPTDPTKRDVVRRDCLAFLCYGRYMSALGAHSAAHHIYYLYLLIVYVQLLFPKSQSLLYCVRIKMPG